MSYRLQSKPAERKFLLRYSDRTYVTKPPHYTMPWCLSQSEANRFIFAARAMHDEVPEIIDASEIGVIR